MLPQDGAMRRVVLYLFVAVPLLFGAIALVLGQDNNWDLRNYHWYDAYAVLSGRTHIDMGAAQIPTFYNPTIDIPFFLLASVLPAWIFSFLLGALHGCNFILLYMLASLTLRRGDARLQILACALIAFVGVTGGGHLAMVGALFYDNVVSLFVFAALIVVVRAAAVFDHGPLPAALRRAALAGFLVGCGVGLKLPTQIFAVGVCFGLLFIPGPIKRRFVLSFVCGLGIIAGFALLGGWWMWDLWTHYANPLFPYFNDVIRSPWALPESYRDSRFLPRDLGQALVLPFRLFVDGKAAGEIAFRDGRVLGAYVVLLATPFMLLVARSKSSVNSQSLPLTSISEVFALRYLAAVAVLSYVTWLKLFAIYRYLIPLEMLAPLIVVAAMNYWPVGRQRQISLAIGLLGFMALTIQPGSWGRIPWGANLGRKMVEATIPALADPDRTLVLMTGLAPTSFAIPAFPTGVVFLRPQSYFIEPAHATRFNEIMHGRIATHAGDIYLLEAVWERAAADRVLPALGLQFQAGGCRPIQANLDEELELCALARAGIAAP